MRDVYTEIAQLKLLICKLTNQLTYVTNNYISLTSPGLGSVIIDVNFNGTTGYGEIGPVIIDYIPVPKGSFIATAVYVDVVKTLVTVDNTSYITVGIDIDAPTAGVDSDTGLVTQLNANMVSEVLTPLLLRATDTRQIVVNVGGSNIISGRVRIFIILSDRLVLNSNVGGRFVESVSGLNTDNTDRYNPIINISVDNSTITGSGTPGDPLIGTAIASPDRFGLEDTTTPLDRAVDMELHNLLLNNASNLFLKDAANNPIVQLSYDLNALAGIVAALNPTNSSGAFLTAYDTGGQLRLFNPTGISGILDVANLVNPITLVFPDTPLAASFNPIIPISITNGIGTYFADTAGNIDITLGGGGGGITSRFGIEDNLGLQNRVINMETFDLTLTNSNALYLKNALDQVVIRFLNDTNVGTVGTVSVYNPSTLAQGYLYPGALGLSNGGGFTAYIRVDNLISGDAPILQIPEINSTQVIPVSVNNTFADNTGNITIPNAAVAVPSAVAATTIALPTNTYANGTAGVGATLTGNANGALPTVDDVILVNGQKILVKDEVDQTHNGIYIVTDIGSAGTPFILTRAITADSTGELYPSLVSIAEGTINGGDIYQQDTINPIVGTDNIVYTLFTNYTYFASRFGIEDNTGVQNRFIDMQAYNLAVMGAGNLEFLAGDPTFVGDYTDLFMSGLNFLITAQSALGVKTFLVRGESVTIETNSDGNKRNVAVSVNNNFADAAGNITLTVGGGGTVTSIGLTSSDITIGGTASPITASGTYTLTLVAVTTAATVGSSTQIPVITYDDKGRIISTTTAAVTGGVSSVFTRTGAVVAQAGDYTYTQITRTKQTHTTGATVTVANDTTWLIVNPATILASLAITLPVTPIDGQDVTVSFGGTITSGGVVTAITFSPTPIDATTPDYTIAGESITYRWNATNTKWYRIN